MKWLLALVTAGLVFASTTSVQAAVTVYTNQAAFNAASTNLTSVNFVGLAPVDSFTFYSPDLTVGGLTFSSAGDWLAVIDPGYIDPSDPTPYWDYGTGRPVLTDNYGGGIGLTTLFPAGTTAASFLIGDYNPTTASITLSSGEIFNLNLAGAPNLHFIGFTSTTPISSIIIQTGDGGTVVDQVQFGQIVPEPATLAVFGLMAAGAFGFRRRLKATA